MHIENPANGFTRVETERYVVLADVWLKDGIFDNSWVNYPTVRNGHRFLSGATHCFISHIHEDHYDLETLARLDRRVQMLVPDVYPNHLVRDRLRGIGFECVRMLKPGVPEEVSDGLVAEVVPRMNAYGQEIDLYQEGETVSLVIDTGLLLAADELTVALLADNVPYQPRDAAPSVERMKGCDLLACSYNGAASDYPLCYDSLDASEKREIATAREELRDRANRAFIEAVSPKALLCYSSEFGLKGPRAIEFATWCSGNWWADKRASAARFQELLGVPSFALYEGDRLDLARGGSAELVAGSAPLPALLDFERALFTETPNTRGLFPDVEPDELSRMTKQAAEHMFEKMSERRLGSQWCLALEPAGHRRAVVDLSERRIRDSAPSERPLLTCRLEPNYFGALLRGDSHWNNAMISFNLTWERRPNVYDRGLYDSLNFFHLPRGRGGLA
jgi:UDP-MurNAc hydroxylase